MRAAGLLPLLAVLAACAATPGTTPGPAPVDLPVAGPAAGGARLGITSIRARRFLTTIRQRTDYSCGSAAVATLLTHHYLTPTTEEEVFHAMMAVGDPEIIRTAGFSLLDMQRFLAARGLRSNGFRVPLDRLAQARIPAIVLVNAGGYRHFVLLRGATEGRVLLSDPNQGTRVMRRADFERIWNGIAFVVLDRAELAQATFGGADDWGVRPAAPFTAVRSLMDGGRVGFDAFGGRFF